ncbi:MAG TPA: 4Fe-4S dicluster domain-containing protein [Candidatus Sulfotelmatobacter sp.]|nr:4Fe-4S dicluster domain-containing protein [Candidatus Sulfotelmatobacter sp.]
MTNTAAAGPIRATLIDITNCIGCRACQVACKQWNEREGEQTELEPDLGFQNPATLSAKTYTLIAFHETENPQKPGGVESAFVMQRCLHCLEPACASACPTTALHRQDDGPVSYDADKCIGCRYCILACPWDVPTAEWNTRAPKISKCTHCADRADQPVPVSFNGKPLSEGLSNRFLESIATPACVKACPADALRFGTREEMLALAHKRISDRPEKYVDHVYGEKELGGTSVVYLSAVPFEKLGFPTYGEKPFPAFTSAALGAVPPAVMTVGALLGASYAFFRKRVQAVADGSAASKHSADHGHVEFEPLRNKLMTPFNWVLLLLMAFGGVSLIARFALGLGGSTHLSDTYPWGLWILFDLVWIAVAAGAFAMAGVIYVFQRKDLYGLGRTAVLTGLLSYSFVTVTLLADLGLPWHFYQLGLQAPAHSAMFEVSWCVGLYVTILLLEFLPVPLERWGFPRAVAAWRRWNGAYVAAAVTLFVYLLSRNLVYAFGTAVIFGALAWMFRARDERAEPIMLAIAAVTLSTMHQSSLGSLYLLMPNMLAPQWWSPVMPVSFFLSSIVAGTALVILIDMWIAKGWRRPLEMTRLASVGQISFWALLVYLVFRLGDMALRNQLSGAFSGRLGMAFAAEILVGGVLPLVLLARRSLRQRAGVLFAAAVLAVIGVTYNRMNVVLFAMTFRGRMPWHAPEGYAPSIVEWGISIGLIAATIFLFGLGARLMPILTKKEA